MVNLSIKKFQKNISSSVINTCTLANWSGTKHKTRYSGHGQHVVKPGLWENLLKDNNNVLQVWHQQDGAWSLVANLTLWWKSQYVIEIKVSDKKRAQRIITHHAHKLLKSCQFSKLGQMCYFLKFDLLQFLQVGLSSVKCSKLYCVQRTLKKLAI